MEDCLKKINGNITIICLNSDTNVIRTLASFLEFESDEIFDKSVDIIIEKHQRHKKYLRKVCDIVYEYKMRTNAPTIAFYSLNDSSYKFLL